MMTKEQERNALNEIKRILEEAGPDSYIGIAFEGCIEDAEQNIENDFGCSMASRYEMAQRTADEYETKCSILTKQLKDTKEALEWVQSKIIPQQDASRLHAIVYNNLAEAKQRNADYALDIVRFADDPTSNEFIDAVARHRNGMKYIEGLEELLESLKKIA